MNNNFLRLEYIKLYELKTRKIKRKFNLKNRLLFTVTRLTCNAYNVNYL